MSNFIPIPFGRRLEDKQLVDVSRVKRGSKCGCVCESCGTPLIARQGEIREWHFAHASKGVSGYTKKECEYSFWVSVVSMAKQVISTASSIKLPSLIMYSGDGSEVVVTRQQTSKLDEVNIEKCIAQVSADAVLSFHEYAVAVIFTAPHKVADVFTPQGGSAKNVGVLEISLSDAPSWFFGEKTTGEYSKKISHHIFSDVENRRWLYHPRVKLIESRNDVKLFNEKPRPHIQGQKIRGTRPVIADVKEHPSHQRPGKQYECRKCSFPLRETRFCPWCSTHEYAVEIGSVKKESDLI